MFHMSMLNGILKYSEVPTEDWSGSSVISFNLFENIWYKISILAQTYCCSNKPCKF